MNKFFEFDEFACCPLFWLSEVCQFCWFPLILKYRLHCFFVSRSQWIGRERSLNVFHLPINWLHTNENPVRSSFLISNVLCAEDIVPSESCEETSDLVSKAQFFYKYDWLNWLRFKYWVSWDNIHSWPKFKIILIKKWEGNSTTSHFLYGNKNSWMVVVFPIQIFLTIVFCQVFCLFYSTNFEFL